MDYQLFDPIIWNICKYIYTNIESQQICQTSGHFSQLSAVWRPQETVSWAKKFNSVWNGVIKPLWKLKKYKKTTLFFFSLQPILDGDIGGSPIVDLHSHCPLQYSDLKVNLSVFVFQLITGPKSDHCLVVSLCHSVMLLNFVQIVTWISFSYYMDSSKLLQSHVDLSIFFYVFPALCQTKQS